MMEEGNDKQVGTEEGKVERQEIFSKAVRAGKRTYFFDVKATRRNDYYLTITESKKRYHRDGRFYFEKHKIFLYKEDFDKFSEGLAESIEFIKTEKPEPIEPREEIKSENTENYTDVEFEDLESVEAEKEKEKEEEEEEEEEKKEKGSKKKE
jgi:hypothetical protein